MHIGKIRLLIFQVKEVIDQKAMKTKSVILTTIQ